MTHLVNESTNKVGFVTADIEIQQVTAPLPWEFAWQIESFLLEIFEYGDYSFRSALRGEYAAGLCHVFFLALQNNRIIAAAGCLYSRRNHQIAILGPVAVAENFRRKGIASTLLERVIDHLICRDCQALYLAAPENNPARKLYRKIGFEKYHGIVMRRLLSDKPNFTDVYFNKSLATNIRPVNWGDFPAVAALMVEPCSMYSFDFREGLFSSRYVEPNRFLPVFPRMMKKMVRHSGWAEVLVAGGQENVVGIAHIARSSGEPRRHVAVLDFFIHDHFISMTTSLLEKIFQNITRLEVAKVNCHVPESDEIKRKAVEALDGKTIAILPKNVLIGGKYEDVLVYEWSD